MGELRECGQTPHQQQSTINSHHSLPDSKPRLTQMKAAKKRGWLEVTPVPFLNPDPTAHLVGCSNEALVFVDGQETTTLIDSGTQVSSVSAKFYEDLVLQIKPLGQLLGLRGTGGAAIPYLRFVEVNLQILGIRNYNEDVLLLVIPTMTYSELVLVMVGSKIIDKALSLMTIGELAKVTMTWQQAHFGAVMSRLLQLSCGSSGKNRTGEGKALLSRGWTCGGVEVQSRWHTRSSLHHTEGHYSTIWHSQCVY